MLDLATMKADVRARLNAKGFPTITLSPEQQAALVAAGQNPNPPMLPELVEAVIECIHHFLVTAPYSQRAAVIEPPADDPQAADIAGRIV